MAEKHLYEIGVNHEHNGNSYYAGKRLVVATSAHIAEEMAIESIRKYRETKEKNYYNNLYSSSIVLVQKDILVEGEQNE